MVGCGTGRAYQVTHARVGGVSGILEARPHCFCDDCFSQKLSCMPMNVLHATNQEQIA